MLALPVFPGRPGIVLPLRNMPVASFRQKKAPTFQSRLLCWHYLSSRVGQVLSWRSNSPVDCCSQNCLEIKKEPSFRLTLLLCWHYLSSRAVARQVLSAQMSLTSVFGMGTGGPSPQSIPTRMDGVCPIFYIYTPSGVFAA